MAVTEAQIRQVKYPPECLPSTSVIQWGAAGLATELDVRRYKPYLARLIDVAVDNNLTSELRFIQDTKSFTISGGASGTIGVPFDFELLARDRLFYELFNSGALANHRSRYSLVIQKPTVAHKLSLGIALTNEEERIKQTYGIWKGVEKGIFPVPITYQILREYLASVETRGRLINVPVTLTDIEVIGNYVTDECIILTGIAAAPGPAASAVQIQISRDEDTNYVPQLLTFPMGLGYDLRCFIPAMREIRLQVIAAAPVANWAVRYTVWRVKMTNILRARWGMLAADELTELQERVKGGVL